MRGGVGGFNWNIKWNNFNNFLQICPDGQQHTFFVYWFLDGVRSINEVQKPRLFLFIFQYLPSLFGLFSFFFFSTFKEFLKF